MVHVAWENEEKYNFEYFILEIQMTEIQMTESWPDTWA